jgi:predicted nicotinamide N-methyase
VIEQDRSVGKGGLVWDAGFVLAEHVINAKEWKSKKPTSIVELGAGTGVTGLMVAKACPTAKVHLTDLPELQPLLKKNAGETSNASVDVLEWGGSGSDKYDVILGADVVASIYDSSGLVKTIYDLANPDSRVYLACNDRLAGCIEKFENQMKQLFTHVERRKAVSSNRNPDVWIMFACGRRSNQ